MMEFPSEIVILFGLAGRTANKLRKYHYSTVRLFGLRHAEDLRQQRILVQDVALAKVTGHAAEVVVIAVEHGAERALAVGVVDEPHPDTSND